MIANWRLPIKRDGRTRHSSEECDMGTTTSCFKIGNRLLAIGNEFMIPDEEYEKRPPAQHTKFDS